MSPEDRAEMLLWMCGALLIMCVTGYIDSNGNARYFEDLHASTVRTFDATIHDMPAVMSMNYDANGFVACSSDSMGLTLNCGDKLYGENINDTRKLEPGRIYVYRKNETMTVVHRLVYCLDDNCTQTIFKGDNNAIGELVNGTAVLYRVDWIEPDNQRYGK